MNKVLTVIFLTLCLCPLGCSDMDDPQLAIEKAQSALSIGPCSYAGQYAGSTRMRVTGASPSVWVDKGCTNASVTAYGVPQMDMGNPDVYNWCEGHPVPTWEFWCTGNGTRNYTIRMSGHPRDGSMYWPGSVGGQAIWLGSGTQAASFTMVLGAAKNDFSLFMTANPCCGLPFGTNVRMVDIGWNYSCMHGCMVRWFQGMLQEEPRTSLTGDR